MKSEENSFEVIVIGGGIAGLTAASYLSRAGIQTLLLEKENKCGGLVNSFERDGIIYDGGIRAMENSGILFPMLRQLGLEIKFVPNKVSLGIEDTVLRINSSADIYAYQDLLIKLYPESSEEIADIIKEIKRIMQYMDVQYGIDNPSFLDIKTDRDYFIKHILPWMVKYAFTYRKIEQLNEPVETFLSRFTKNQSLIDIITQHFFHATPASFALSYLTLYLDYHYPLGGTGILIEKLVDYIEANGGIIKNNILVTCVDPERKTVTDQHGNSYTYQQLLWAADLKTLYTNICVENLTDKYLRVDIDKQITDMQGKTGNDSVLTLFLGLELDRSYFSKIATEHFFYTPVRTGESSAGPVPIGKEKAEIKEWLQKFFQLTTYEIACPVLRDPTLAPSGKTGLIISVLFDYKFTKYIHDSGWYDEFKSFSQNCMIETLEKHIYPGLSEKIVHHFSATPLTMEKVSGSTEGAITGWAFTNQPMPAETRLLNVFKSAKTPIPGILQAGQWTFSPAGFPISILTGKIASDITIKELNK